MNDGGSSPLASVLSFLGITGDSLKESGLQVSFRELTLPTIGSDVFVLLDVCVICVAGCGCFWRRRVVPHNRSEAMAEERYRKRIRSEVTCSICLSYFTRPVELGCRHNFCEACILRCWEESGERTRCPECRKAVKTDYKQNRLLTNMVGIISEWDHSEERDAQRRRSECQRHQKTLDLFCRDDEAPFCGECDISQGHSGHRVVPVEEAFQDYKEKLMSHRQKMKDEFKQLHLFMEKWENQLLKKMEEMEQEITRKLNEHLGWFSRELDSLQNIIRELEEKHQQPPSEFLQDVRSTLQSLNSLPKQGCWMESQLAYLNLLFLHRHEGRQAFEPPKIFPPEFMWKILDIYEIYPFLKAVAEQFKGTLTSGLSLKKASVTLDPDTAHPHLILSEDRRSARWEEAHQELPDNPERFSGHPFVLGCEEFTAGRHYWEVTMDISGEWAVGVARKSVRRKGMLYFTPEEGIWGLRHLRSLPAVKQRRIRVAVNYAARQILFFDADTGKSQYVTMAEFSGEPLLPIFWVGPETCLELPPVTH
ncbi:E3 ubiquitin-protein ligase TRIM7-like [Podarcis raffonei]|uniref:E3 ubiquitin-protein ligase TRIM7-like n=1 Tax=Podarcis raffonei TaxID=65483 RepID=UPI002329672D|nr:E3 ubiquitin-protein ligase TRIM7-like [Podarcis raffonei]